MKNLELEGFGLVEMKHEEMLLVDGGGFWEKVIEYVATKIVEEMVTNPHAFVSPNAHTTPYGHMGGARP